ncbi:MAG: hypothetical protein SFU85_07500 [Candidatus Methylacidiphilales bacterium]|nr:hypothetical protein [Candidatus Methylacidiphilales bacterium]
MKQPPHALLAIPALIVLTLAACNQEKAAINEHRDATLESI